MRGHQAAVEAVRRAQLDYYQSGNGEDQDWNSYMGRSSAGGGTAQREIAEV